MNAFGLTTKKKLPKVNASIVNVGFLYIFMDRFKKWIQNEDDFAVVSGNGTTIKQMDVPFGNKHEILMHGGLSNTPFHPGNSNMPVRSKHQTKDGRTDDEPFDIEPAKLFGFRKWMSKMGKKRLPNRIHKSRAVQTGVPIRSDRPMM